MAKAWIPTDRDIVQVERMAKIGMTVEQIAVVLGRGRRSMFKDLKAHPDLQAAYDRGKQFGIDEISNTAYAMALSGKVPAMTIFWLKCQARWKEVTHVEHSGTLTLEKLVAGSYQPEIIEHKPSGNITRGSRELLASADDSGGVIHDNQETLERSDAD